MNKQLELPTSPEHFILLFFNESKIGSIAKCASVISCALKGSGGKKEPLWICSAMFSTQWNDLIMKSGRCSNIYGGEENLTCGIWCRFSLIKSQKRFDLFQKLMEFQLGECSCSWLFDYSIYHSAGSPEKIKWLAFDFTDPWRFKIYIW